MDKEEKLKYTLFELNGHLIFSIFHMDERFRSQGNLLEFIANNGWKICSLAHPEVNLEEKKIYLQGHHLGKDREVCVEEPYGENLPEVIDQIHSALKEWAEEWEGWQEEQPKPHSNLNFPTFSC